MKKNCLLLPLAMCFISFSAASIGMGLPPNSSAISPESNKYAFLPLLVTSVSISDCGYRISDFEPQFISIGGEPVVLYKKQNVSGYIGFYIWVSLDVKKHDLAFKHMTSIFDGKVTASAKIDGRLPLFMDNGKFMFGEERKIEVFFGELTCDKNPGNFRYHVEIVLSTPGGNKNKFNE